MGDVTHLNTPESVAKRNESRRRNISIKEAMLDAFDKLGAEAYLLEFARSESGEDRRAFLQLLGKILPIEIRGALDASLTVKVVTQTGLEIPVDISRVKQLPKDVGTAALPVEQAVTYAPEEDEVEADG